MRYAIENIDALTDEDVAAYIMAVVMADKIRAASVAYGYGYRKGA